MKISLGKTTFAIAAIGVMIYTGMMFAGCGSDSTTAAPGPDKYSGTVYVAGHGGHFAKAALNIDVSQDPPITATLTKTTVSTLKFDSTYTTSTANTSQYKLHDARLDGNTLYWSTYNLDANNKVHYGSIDLATNTVTDNVLDPPARATKPGVAANKMPYYCASGISATAHMPMTMTHEAYITVIKKAGGTPTNVFLESLLSSDVSGTGMYYKFLHGSSSPDKTKLFVSLNKADAAQGNVTGDVLMYVLDAAALEAATPAVTKVAGPVVVTGVANKTTSFRSSWSPDGSKIALAAADRLFILNATTLAPENGTSGFAMPTGHDNHDALFTSDGKYVVLTLRATPSGKTYQDGLLALYDVAGGKLVGTTTQTTSACNQCHSTMDTERTSVLCGLDGTLTKQ